MTFRLPNFMFRSTFSLPCSPQRMKAGIRELKKTALARQHVPAATNTRATVEQLLDVVFSMWPVSNQTLNMKR
jgi:hypothetical protein